MAFVPFEGRREADLGPLSDPTPILMLQAMPLLDLGLPSRLHPYLRRIFSMTGLLLLVSFKPGLAK
jgi:hypothetical protein